jgi:hypothetical protein
LRRAPRSASSAQHRAEQAAREAKVGSPAASHRFRCADRVHLWRKNGQSFIFGLGASGPRAFCIFALAEAVELYDTYPANVNDCATRIEAI